VPARTGLLSVKTVQLAVVLRDRAKFDLVTLSGSILDLTFQNLMDDVHDNAHDDLNATVVKPSGAFLL
jgi:hypothetical protein